MNNHEWITIIVLFCVLPMFAMCHAKCENDKSERAWHQSEQLARDDCAAEYRLTKDYERCMEEWYQWQYEMAEAEAEYYDGMYKEYP